MTKLTLLILLLFACRAVNGQDVPPPYNGHADIRMDKVVDTFYKSHGGWIWIHGKDITWVCCELKEDTTPIHKPSKPVKKKVNNLALLETDVRPGDTTDPYLQRLLSGKDNSDYGFKSGAISTDTVPVHKPKKPVALLDGYPIPDILQRLTALEKREAFLTRRVNELELEIANLKKAGIWDKPPCDTCIQYHIVPTGATWPTAGIWRQDCETCCWHFEPAPPAISNFSNCDSSIYIHYSPAIR